MILVTGATGFLGTQVCRLLDREKLPHIRTSLSLGLDLRDREATFGLFDSVRPTHVLNCAAYVGGIQFGLKFPAEIFTNNLLMTISLLEAAHRTGVRRIVNPISNCAYPRRASLFREEEFWDGPLDETVLAYGFVRKASWVGAWAFAKQYGLDVLNLIMSNMYGPGDHFDEERSHALGALIMRFVKAKRENAPFLEVWGTGKPVREWLHVDDGAQAMVRGLSSPGSLEPVNVGVAKGISVMRMAELIKKYVGYAGDIRVDPTKPDGAPYKTVDGIRGAALLNWTPQIPFETGVRDTIQWYSENK